MTTDAPGAEVPIPRGEGASVTAGGTSRAAHRTPARTVRDQRCLPPVAAGARTADPAGSAAESLWVENANLFVKLSRLSGAIQALASELAASRRECRRQELEIRALRGQNARLREHAD